MHLSWGSLNQRLTISERPGKDCCRQSSTPSGSGSPFTLSVANVSGPGWKVIFRPYDRGLFSYLALMMSKPVLKKLPASAMAYVMPLILSIIMSCIVSLISTVKSTGFSGFELKIWLSAWALSWMVAYPVLLLILPLVRKLTALIVETPKAH
jgi:hypothetical protein